MSAWTLCVAADWLQGPYVYALYEARFFPSETFKCRPGPTREDTWHVCVFYGNDFWNLPPKLPCQLHEKWHSLSLFTAKTYLSPGVGFVAHLAQHVKAYGFRPHEIAQLFVAGFGSAMISSCCSEKLELFVACLDILGYVQDTKQQQQQQQNQTPRQTKTKPTQRKHHQPIRIIKESLSDDGVCAILGYFERSFRGIIFRVGEYCELQLNIEIMICLQSFKQLLFSSWGDLHS